MREQINTGGPAFPRGQDCWGECNDGMSLRDYFAAHATEEDILDAIEIARFTGKSIGRRTARFHHADAMLAAREGKK